MRSTAKVCVYIYLFDKGVGGAGMKRAWNVTCRREGRERMTRDKVQALK